MRSTWRHIDDNETVAKYPSKSGKVARKRYINDVLEGIYGTSNKRRRYNNSREDELVTVFKNIDELNKQELEEYELIMKENMKRFAKEVMKIWAVQKKKGFV